ncbi:WD40 repeat domain-containing protein [Nonomuraea jiangxiensis]|uniref:WD40 repeat domain-containing protein n=1 Tax=Nonomuraea jiangxiensis TaxID=633440 RepID=UPI000B820E2F|nr:WD40 repeat domain-containing protein [Nonomuraea jiangxiensis]
MAEDTEQDDGGLRAAARAGVAAVVTRSAPLAPPALLAVLSAGALVPMALAALAGTAVPVAELVGGVGANVLSTVLTDAVAALRRRTSTVTPEEAEDELRHRLAARLDAEAAGAGELRGEIAALLREVGAGQVALKVAVESGDRDLQSSVVAAFAELGERYAETACLLEGLEQAALEIQRSLHRQDAEHRHDRDLLRHQLDQLALIRSDVAALRQPDRAPGGGPLWAGGSPYRGLWPFETDHAPIFYGRERETVRLLRTVAERLDGPALVVVTGASGAGKSSLVRAGLLPALARGALAEPGSARWPHLVLTPTRDPLTELATQLAARARLDALTVRRFLADRPDQAHLLIRQILLSCDGAERLVVVVDQFEELYSLAPDEPGSAAFLQALAAAATGPPGAARPPALVVVTVRGDFVDRCAADAALAEALQDGQFVVGPMRPAELMSAIAGPAAAAGVALEAGLADVVLKELGPQPGAGVLPLLSQAMLATWDNRQEGRLTVRGYERGGGVAHAVRTSAEAAYDALTPHHQDLARRLFLRMTAISPTGHPFRRPLRHDELAAPVQHDTPVAQGEHGTPVRHDELGGREERADVAAVLESFAARRLVVLGEDTAEIAHDCLLLAWPRLRGWLGQDEADHAMRSQLLADAEHWDRHGRDRSFLYRGARLTAAQQARARWRAAPDRFPALERAGEDFLRAGEEATALRARAAARRRGWARAAVSGLVVLSVVAVVAAVAAVRSAGTAETRRREALSRQVAAQSVALTGMGVVLPGLLAVAAHQISPTPEARHAMLNVLAQPVKRVLRTGAGIRALLSANGRTLVVLDADGMARRWDIRAGRQATRAFATHPGGAGSAALSSDGRTLAIMGADRAVRLHDPATGRRLRPPFARHRYGVRNMALSPDGRLLATTDSRHAVRVWNVTTGRQVVGPLTSSPFSADTLALAPGGKILAAGGDNLPGSTWDLPSGRRRQLMNWQYPMPALAFRADGVLLATGGMDHTVRLWNPVTHRQVGGPLIGHLGPVRVAAFSPDGTMLATSGEDRTVRLWDVRRRIQLVALPSPAQQLAFSSTGGTLVSVDQRDVSLWDVAGLTRSVITNVNDASYTAFSPDGTLLAVADPLVEDAHVNLIDLRTRRRVGAPLPHRTLITGLAFDGGILVVGTSDGTVHRWEPGTRRRATTRLPAPERAGTAMPRATISPDGKIAAIPRGGRMSLYAVDSGQQAGPPLPGDIGRIRSAEFSADGGVLVATGDKGDGWVWDVRHRRLIGGRLHLPGLVRGIDPTGTTLVVSDESYAVHLFDLAGRLRTGVPFTGHTGWVTAAAFSPDGKILVTGAHNGEVRVWDVATHRQLGSARNIGGSVFTVGFAPGGRSFAVGGMDRTVRLWNAREPSDPVAELCALAGRSLTREEWAQSVPGEPYRTVCPS